MRYRVIDLNTGKKVKLTNNERFALTVTGELLLINNSFQPSFDLNSDFIIEFAFEKDQLGKWVWGQAVFTH